MKELPVALARELDELVFQALGQASMCWSDICAAGEFQSVDCTRIGRALIDGLKELLP